MQIIQAVPQHTVLAILSTAAKRLLDSMELQSSSAGFKLSSVSEQSTYQRKALMKAHASRLLQLLPDTFHPAVVQTFCLSPSDARCCELQLSVSCKALGDACGEAAGPPCPCITPALQFLAATARLTGGSADPHTDRVSDSDEVAVLTDSASDVHRSMHDSGSRGRLQLLPAAGDPDFVSDHDFAWQLPGGAITSLRLEIDTASAPSVVPPLWWTALGLLRALRAVSLTIGVQRENVATDIRAPELAAALRSLPELASLELERAPAPRVCDDDVDGEEAPEWEDVWISERDYYPDDGAMLELLDAISCMSQLESLSLTAILKFPPVATASAVRGPCGAAAIDVIGQLSRLSRLTRLAFSTAVRSVESGWAAAFAGAVKRLPSLQELEMELVVIEAGDLSLRSAGPEELLVALLTGPGLPALRRLACSATEENGYLDPLPEFSAALLHEAMREQNAALLTRFTALRLQYIFELWQAEALAAMIGDMPALQSLDLRGNNFKDHGLLCLARVVPRLPGLTHLNVCDCIAARAGVLALLEALLQPGAAGRERLRCLDISMNSTRPRSAQRLADALRQFRSLTSLDMAFLELGREGLRVVVEALETLPELRQLDARGNGVGNVRSLFTGCPADVPDMPNGVFWALRLHLHCTDSLRNCLTRSVCASTCFPREPAGFWLQIRWTAYFPMPA